MSNLVIKDNALINASYDLSLVEQRLILLAILEIKRQSIPNLKPNEVWVRADSYIEHFDVHRNTAYQALKDAIKDLKHREFSFLEVVNNKKIMKTRNWVIEIGYAMNDAFVTLEFDPNVMPLISELERRFTSYDISEVAELSSAYAIRLYEILIAWRSTGKVPLISTEELRNKLGVLDGEYARMERFKTKIIENSIDQINKTTDIKVSYEQHKSGRNITGFTFSFKVKKTAKAKKVVEIKPLKFTDKQLQSFSKQLAVLPALGGDAPIGASTEDYARVIASELTDKEKQKKYIKYLDKLGFKVS